MALLSDLVRIVAAVEGLEEVSVGIFARAAREAGYISQGGRGRSAAKMTVKDAANLLIAVNGCQFAKDVPVVLAKIRELKANPNANETLTGVGNEGAKFGDDLERLIHLFEKVDGERQWADPPGPTYIRFFRPDIKIEIEMSPSMGAERQEEVVSYGAFKSDFDPSEPDRSDETVISNRTIRAIAEAL